MTPLKALILQLLKSHGPMNELELWGHLRKEIGLLNTRPVVTYCAELQSAGFIERPQNDPHIWQLSNQGLDYVAAHKQQEVTLES